MLGNDVIDLVPREDGAGRCGNAREAVLVVTMLYAFARGSEALAADQIAARSDFDPQDTTPRVAVGVPQKFDLSRVPFDFSQAPREFSASEFRPRQHYNLEQTVPSSAAANDDLRTTTVWQRLTDYRSKNRVRLITLWESPGSSLSIQTGRHGEPSLQWSSSSMNRGGATKGLLDQVISASLGAVGIAQLRGLTHSSSAYSAAPKPVLSRISSASLP